MDAGFEGREDVSVRKGEGQAYFACVDNPLVVIYGGGFADVFSRVPTCAVDDVELEDFIFTVWVPDDIAENCVHSCCCVGEEDDCGNGGVEELGDGGTGVIEVFRELEFDEGAGRCFAFIAKFSSLIANGGWEGAEGALIDRFSAFVSRNGGYSGTRLV